MQTIDPLSTTFAALADPTRRAILSRLTTGEATVNQLSAPFDVSLQAISRHLKVLERAGLITRRRDAQFRPCRFEAEPLDNAVEWIERHRRVWGERFDQLEAHLVDLQRRAPRPEGTAPGHRTTDSTADRTTDRAPARAPDPTTALPTDPTTHKEQPS
jgi:DNA-binding transcriptional ArsR family regulator